MFSFIPASKIIFNESPDDFNIKKLITPSFIVYYIHLFSETRLIPKRFIILVRKDQILKIIFIY